MNIYVRFCTLFLCSLLALTKVDAQQKKDIVFTPQWTAQAQFVGYYAALEQGYYDAEGLNVTIKHPNQTLNAMEMLRSGESDFVTSDLLSSLMAKDGGFDIVNIYQSSQNSALMLVSHDSLANGLKSLQNKHIGRWKAGFSLLAINAMNSAGITVQWVDFMSGVNLFLSGAIDASLVMSYNEYLSIIETGKSLNDSQILRFSDLDLNLPEEGLYTTAKMLSDDKATVTKFASASAKGWQWVHDNPEEALDLVMTYVKKENIPTNKTHQRGMLQEVLRLQKNTEGEIITSLSKDDFEAAVKVLLLNGAIEHAISFEEFTNKDLKTK